MTRIYDFNGKVPNFDGTELPDASSYAAFLAPALGSGQSDSADLGKLFIWTKELARPNGGKLPLDNEDIKKLKSVVGSSRMLNNWIKGGILEILDSEGEALIMKKN